MFTYSIEQFESKVMVSLNGDMDIDGTEMMEEELPNALRPFGQIDLNFKHVSFVDSSGIGLLITLVNDLRENGKRVVISHLQSDVKEVFFMLQLPEILGYDVFEAGEM